MNYEKMDDFEINTLIAETIGLNWFCAAGDSPTGGWEYCRIDELVIKDDSRLKDYCNNASDAWPIIVENKITIFSPNGTHDDSLWMAELDEFHAFSINPLRAAMIVYLMIQESK